MCDDGWSTHEQIELVEKKLLEAYNKLTAETTTETIEEDVFEDETHEEEFRRHNSCSTSKRTFTPPLQIQRNSFARDELLKCVKEGVVIKKLAILGCGELSLERALVGSYGRIGIERIVSIDIDEHSLAKGKRFMQRHLEVNKNVIGGADNEPVHLEIYKGSILDTDLSLHDVDAVVCLEVIEHMPLEEASRVFLRILENIKPKVAILSTPNHDYNSVFNMAPGVFRHDDHHFEFSREEFENWVKTHVAPSEYSASVDYVGNVQGSEHLSGATQFVICRQEEHKECVIGEEKNFKKVADFVIPFGLLWLIRQVIKEAMIAYLESGKLKECEVETLTRKYYIVPLDEIIKFCTPERRSVVEREKEFACRAIATATHNNVFHSFHKECFWSVIVPESLPVYEIIDQLKEIEKHHWH